jgi:exopolyphosphatase/pppGpp-phosphohydrolase
MSRPSSPPPLAALDLGSGTVKLSVFAREKGRWTPLCLDEKNTELRRGLGPERTLKPEPLAETLAACQAFLGQARALGVERLPAYATSAVRKAVNPEALLKPLRALGIETRVLSEEEEGRLNLLGALARLAAALSEPGSGSVAAFAEAAVQAGKILVLDPGGDSTECVADVEGKGWEGAAVASLPFGSVGLQERYGLGTDSGPIAWNCLEEVRAAARAMALEHPVFRAFVGQGLFPCIRMNEPIQRALEQLNGRAHTPHGSGADYARAELQLLCRHLAGLDHVARAALLEGEPIGKVDRTCYGFASWLGLLDALQAEAFAVEPWGIKLGAVLFLNGAVLPSV